jgi:hypothetical protein
MKLGPVGSLATASPGLGAGRLGRELHVQAVTAGQAGPVQHRPAQLQCLAHLSPSLLD